MSKITLAAVTTLAAIVTWVGLRAPVAHAKESRFACDRDALSPAERKRHFEEIGPELRARRIANRELPDGYEFEMPTDATTYQLLTEWSFQEARCCPFFDVSVRLDREGGPLWLRLTGRPGTKEFIRGDFDKWFPK